MLSIEVFHAQFINFLCVHWNKQLTEQLSSAYYEAFKRFSDESFTELCQQAFIECDRMPAPKWFHEKSFELAQKARVSPPPERTLPDADRHNVVSFTPEQLIANQKRLRELCKNLGVMPGANNVRRDS